MDPELVHAARSWIASDPDPGDRAELSGLLALAGGGESAAAAELASRFAGRLRFGTAGLRGAMGAGPARMNRAMVRMATAAVAKWLLAPPSRVSMTHRPPSMGVNDSSTALVVVGCDARHRSAEFAEEAVRVLAGAGIRVHVLPLPCPTPLLAFAVRHLRANAGVMITASHNPPADNGYKLYLSDGAQVIPPADAQVEELMSRVGVLTAVPLAEPDDPLITRRGDEIAAAYLDAIAVPTTPRQLRVVYTPMHGVAGPLMLRAIARAGFEAPLVVREQAEPDPDFPTLAFPNPEEPGALDQALALASITGVQLVIASDPDGDRLAVAVPVPEGGWTRLTGDQVGALLGAFLLRTRGDGPGEPVVASTIVSSSLLAKIAAAAGAKHVETLTGFKWIARAADGMANARFVFGYEEAIGYQVGTAVRDKDGIGAALAVLRLASSGPGLLAEWDELERVHGVHLTAQVSVRTQSTAEVMARLRAESLAKLAGSPVTTVVDYLIERDGLPVTDALRYEMADGWVAIRPSGTEPKIKAYLEVVIPPGRPIDEARAAARERMNELEAAVRQLLAPTPSLS